MNLQNSPQRRIPKPTPPEKHCTALVESACHRVKEKYISHIKKKRKPHKKRGKEAKRGTRERKRSVQVPARRCHCIFGKMLFGILSAFKA
jgi:hypothetical protein